MRILYFIRVIACIFSLKDYNKIEIDIGGVDLC